MWTTGGRKGGNVVVRWLERLGIHDIRIGLLGDCWGVCSSARPIREATATTSATLDARQGQFSSSSDNLPKS